MTAAPAHPRRRPNAAHRCAVEVRKCPRCGTWIGTGDEYAALWSKRFKSMGICSCCEWDMRRKK